MSIQLSTNKEITTIPTQAPWKAEDCKQEKVNALLVEKFKALVADANYRKSEYKNDQKILDKGFWYPNDYYHALKDTNQKTRLEFFRKKSSFYHGYPPLGFEHLDNPATYSKKEVCGYALKANMPPTQGLKSIKENLCFIDCLITTEIAYYDTILEIVGEARFDKFFSAKRMAFHRDIAYTPVYMFLEKDTGPLKLGNHVYFANFPLYVARHLFGEGRGYHAFCVQLNPTKFLALGNPNEGLTQDEEYDVLVKDFNAEPLKNDSVVTQEFADKMLQDLKSKNDQFCTNFERAKTINITKEDLIDHQNNNHQVGLLPAKFQLSINNIKKLLAEQV